MKWNVWAAASAFAFSLSGAALLGARAYDFATAAHGAAQGASVDQNPAFFYGFTVQDIEGREVPLRRYVGKVLLIVNVASECGFTPQYKGLEALYRKYKERGFVILGFPSNDFLHQEPGTDAEIKSFCERNFQVSFDLFSKIHVQEKPQAPLYRYLTSEVGLDGPISWNFNKFLVGRDGRVIQRWGSSTKPESPELTEALEKALAR